MKYRSSPLHLPIFDAQHCCASRIELLKEFNDYFVSRQQIGRFMIYDVQMP